MERGPSVAIKISKPAVTAPRSVESGLSFRITSKQTKAPLILGAFKPSVQPATERPARAFNFKDTVPFVAPTMDFTPVVDPKPAPTKLRFGEFKPQAPVVTDTKVEPYYPEKFTDFPVPTVKKEENQPVMERQQRLPVILEEATTSTRLPKPGTGGQVGSSEKDSIAVYNPPNEGLQNLNEAEQVTKIRTELQTISETKPKAQTQTSFTVSNRMQAETFQEARGVRRNTTIHTELKPITKAVGQKQKIFAFSYKKEETEQKKSVKFIKDKVAIAARKARILIATTWLYAEKVYNTFGMYTGIEKYTVSGKELAGKMGVPSDDVISGLAKKIGIHDNTFDLVVDKVREMPETESVADAIDFMNHAVDENPAVDVKNEKEAQGEEMAAPKDVVRVLAEALLS